MAEDDILFHRGEGKIPVGVAQGGEGMAEAVEPVGRIGVMPVIEEIIVKQRAAHQFLPAEGKGEQIGGPAAEVGHRYAVEQAAGVAVLAAGVGFQQTGAQEHGFQRPAKGEVGFLSRGEKGQRKASFGNFSPYYISPCGRGQPDGAGKSLKICRQIFPVSVIIEKIVDPSGAVPPQTAAAAGREGGIWLKQDRSSGGMTDMTQGSLIFNTLTSIIFQLLRLNLCNPVQNP